MESFGAYLKAHREKKGIRLEEIASITKIHPHSLELLEGDRWDALPPEPFVRGFILAYAKYVGLSAQEVIEKYRESTGQTPAPIGPAQESMASAAGQRAGTPPIGAPSELITQVRLPSGAKMITALSLIAVIGLTALLINVGRDAETPSTATPVAAAPETPAATPAKEEDRKIAVAPVAEAKPPAVASMHEPAPVEATMPPGPPAHEIVVEGKERTWMKVVIDDAPPQEVFLGEGKSATYKAANKIKVVLGNATGTRVVYNGKEVEGKQFMGTIRSYKFPANARFPQDMPSKRATTAEGEAPAAAPAPTE